MKIVFWKQLCGYSMVIIFKFILKREREKKREPQLLLFMVVKQMKQEKRTLARSLSLSRLLYSRI